MQRAKKMLFKVAGKRSITGNLEAERPMIHPAE
jgi:hypothetical protein